MPLPLWALDDPSCFCILITLISTSCRPRSNHRATASFAAFDESACRSLTLCSIPDTALYGGEQ
jgi:hypothetical protein